MKLRNQPDSDLLRKQSESANIAQDTMVTRGPITPANRSVRKYYEQVAALRDQRVLNEMNVRSAFESLLADTAKLKGWTFIPELSGKSGGTLIRPDGTLRDRNSLPRGYWEAKDTQDDLPTEIKKKIARGYPLTNIIFEDTQTGILIQNRQQVDGEFNLGNPKALAALLNQFLSYTEPDIEGFEEAVDEFKESVPELARGLVEKIQHAHKDNPRFQTAFEKFFDLCRTALNPNIRVEAVDEMLVQHLLTERLFRTVFNNPEFVKRNAIAAEVERVIDALVSKSFDRTEYLKGLDRFYVAIEGAARLLPDFSEKQHFLNTVYERFFQGYSVKVADTHGIVYTPQEIVNFMCASVAEVLEKEFGRSLSSPDVYIIDPCTGTGNFIVNLLRRMPGRDLPRVYRDQLFANEVMLLPYYIAALNIEHAYYELTGTYEPFDGLCFVDTLDLAERQQLHMYMTEKNAERVERERGAPITVVIGNPPYNMNQQNENDNNKNRKYEVIDRRVAETYAKDSTASNKGALSDPYVKFFRWATDRLGTRDGIVAFVSNDSFVDQQAFDGMRRHILCDFTSLYHIDLHGNVRRNPKLSGTTHNVFGIRVGVGITVGVRRKAGRKPSVSYFRVPENWRKEEKLRWLEDQEALSAVNWKNLEGGTDYSWTAGEQTEVPEGLLAIGSKLAKAREKANAVTVFKTFSRGIETARDEWTYAFNASDLTEKVKRLIDTYNSELDRWRRAGKPKDIDNFVTYDARRIKWSSRLKEAFGRGVYSEFDERRMRSALYRPFTKRIAYFDPILTHRRGIFAEAVPNASVENVILCCTNHLQIPFSVQMTNCTPDFGVGGRAGQCFPFYLYEEDGTNRRENTTDWALDHFREHYDDKEITKWDIFYYVYAVLHHPEYRAKYAEKLKRELPRIPLAKDFWGFSKAGEELARLHVDYENLEPYPLRFIETCSGVLGAEGVRSDVGPSGARPRAKYDSAQADRRSALRTPFSYRVEDKMRLSKDRRSLKVNDSLTLGGVPPEAFEYRLGNRSALEWVIDQYQVTEDKRSGIRSDPNRGDDPEYIVRLVGQVIYVSLETVRIVKSLPAL